jgi:hypothetical protein
VVEKRDRVDVPFTQADNSEIVIFLLFHLETGNINED